MILFDLRQLMLALIEHFSDPWFLKRDPMNHELSLKREIKAAQALVSDARKYSPYVLRPLPSDAPNCIITKGFAAPDFIYNPLRYFLEHELGIRTHMQDLEWASWDDAIKIFWNKIPENYFRPSQERKNHADSVVRKHGRIDFLISHSLGGPEQLALLGIYPEAKKMIAIAGVFNNGNQWPVVEAAEKLIRIPEALQRSVLEKSFKDAKPHGDKIVSVAAEGDYLVPPSHAAFPGAKQYVYLLSQDAGFQNSHTYLPNTDFVKDIIRKEFV